MGILAHFNFSKLPDRFFHFVETGTGRGASLTFAANYPFRSLRSVEIDATHHKRAKEMFETEPRARCYLGHTLEVLPDMLADIPLDEPVVFWLDAHNPGCFYGWPANAFEKGVRLPLEKEMELIRELRHGAERDLFLIDDLRIYLQGEWQNGNLPSNYHTLEPHERNINFVFGLFGRSHQTRIDRSDDGYLVLTPRHEPAPDLTKPLVREMIDIARCYIETGSIAEADPIYERVLQLTDPPASGADRIARGEAAHYKAMEALSRKLSGTAIDWFQTAISADPECVLYRHDLISRGLIPMGWHDFAESEAMRTVGMFPEDPMAWRAYLYVQKERGHEAEARKASTVLSTLADDEETQRAIAAFEWECGNFELAIGMYRQLLETKTKRRAEFLHDIAMCTDRMGKPEEAVAMMDEVVALGTLPDKALLHWNRGWMLLSLGRYEEGWKDVQAREGLKEVLPALGTIARRFRRPTWHMDTPPSRVHVHGEQGFGDVLALSRWVPLIRDMGHDVRLEVAPSLEQLFRDSFDGVTVVKRSPDYPGSMRLPDFDYHIPMMALPSVFKCTLDNIPNQPYLRSPVPVPKSDKPRIGLCWESGVRNGIWFKEYAARKTVPLDQRFTRSSLKEIGDRVDWWVADFENNPMTFAESAAHIASLDLFITVDSAPAHLAGALGVPTWLLMHTNGSWHFMVGGRDERWEERSPWYPSIRLFRQDKPHEWGDVLHRVLDDLSRFLG